MGLASAKLLIEAPVNGGRNYELDQCSYVKKSGYMLEYLSIRQYSSITGESIFLAGNWK